MNKNVNLYDQIKSKIYSSSSIPEEHKLAMTRILYRNCHQSSRLPEYLYSRYQVFSSESIKSFDNLQLKNLYLHMRKETIERYSDMNKICKSFQRIFSKVT